MCIQMEIEFRNNRMQKLCERVKFATHELGSSCAKKLHRRIADIQAANDVSELPAGKLHPLKGERQGQFALELSDGKRLIFVSANNPTPLNEDGSMDWSRVTKIRVIEIGDYHD